MYKYNKKMYVLLYHAPIQEQGTAFNIQGHQHIFHGTVALISADNPASAELGGFKKGASALHPCRKCTGLNADIKEKVSV